MSVTARYRASARRQFRYTHGHANALVLPHADAYGDTAVDQQLSLLSATGISDSGHPETRARAFIAEVEKRLPMWALSDGPALKRDKFDVIAEAAMDGVMVTSVLDSLRSRRF